MWNELVGTWGYLSGNAPGTVAVPAGASIVSILVHASAASTLTIFGGSSIVIPALGNATLLRFNHRLVVSGNNTNAAGSQNLVFGTNVDMYFIEYVKAGNF